MGMYTGLRFMAEVNDEALEVLTYLRNRRAPGTWIGWEAASKEFPQYDWVGMWSGIGRCNFIPWGGICYVTDWAGTSENYVDDLKGRTWTVVCSLKNYEGEIEFFLERILPFMLCSPCTAESFYEEADEPTYRIVHPVKKADL